MAMVNNTVRTRIPRRSTTAKPPPGAKAPAGAGATASAEVRRNGRYANDPVSLGLRQLWHEIENEPVPSKFLDLLDAIDAANRSGSAGAAVAPSDGTGDSNDADRATGGDSRLP